jgi:hypothetical protein
MPASKHAAISQLGAYAAAVSTKSTAHKRNHDRDHLPLAVAIYWHLVEEADDAGDARRRRTLSITR